MFAIGSLGFDPTGKPVKVKHPDVPKNADVIFECPGPFADDCSVLVMQANGRRKRVMCKILDVTFIPPEEVKS